MAYTRKDFGKELKEKVKARESVESIADWAYSIYWEHMLDIDDNFQDFLVDFSGMSAGPEFELDYHEIDQIADQLIVGKIIVFREIWDQKLQHGIIKF